jgi:hypothetical protein
MIYILTTKEKKICMFTNDHSRCNVKNKVCDDKQPCIRYFNFAAAWKKASWINWD